LGCRRRRRRSRGWRRCRGRSRSGRGRRRSWGRDQGGGRGHRCGRRRRSGCRSRHLTGRFRLRGNAFQRSGRSWGQCRPRNYGRRWGGVFRSGRRTGGDRSGGRRVLLIGLGAGGQHEQERCHDGGHCGQLQGVAAPLTRTSIIYPVCHSGICRASRPTGLASEPEHTPETHGRISMVFEAMTWRFRSNTLGIKRLEGAMNVHVYTQPG